MLCTCHFTSENQYPLPYFEYESLKRKQLKNERETIHSTLSSGDDNVTVQMHKDFSYETNSNEMKFHTLNETMTIEKGIYVVKPEKIDDYTIDEVAGPSGSSMMMEHGSAVVKSENTDDYTIFEVSEMSQPQGEPDSMHEERLDDSSDDV